MKVAVITPYYKEPIETLLKCHKSVSDQSFKVLHVMVADGFPNYQLNNLEIDHIILPKSHNDIGSTPRLIGCYHAIGLGCEAVTFLDADNWYRADHIESLVKLFHETKAPFLYSNRNLCRLDDTIIKVDDQSFPSNFIDTNSMMFTRECFNLLEKWVLMPSYAHLIGDRVMTYYVNESGVQQAYTGLPTVFYRCTKEGIYLSNGEIPPLGTFPKPDYDSSFEQWIADGNPPLK
jgi:glycosyltransferase involved in cell wall biosynthesis